MTTLRDDYDELFVQKTHLLQDKQIKKRKLIEVKKNIKICQEAHYILIEISKAIQKQFKDKVDSLITSIIQFVYNYPFLFELKFEQKRNNIAIKPIVKKGKTELIPKDDMGGGILDIISIGFKIILWYMQNPQTRPILFLDEPFKFLGQYAHKAGFMLKYLSKSFGIQVVMTSHDKTLLKFCDKVYKVNYDGIESTVTRQLKRRR